MLLSILMQIFNHLYSYTYLSEYTKFNCHKKLNYTKVTFFKYLLKCVSLNIETRLNMISI